MYSERMGACETWDIGPKLLNIEGAGAGGNGSTCTVRVALVLLLVCHDVIDAGSKRMALGCGAWGRIGGKTMA